MEIYRSDGYAKIRWYVHMRLKGGDCRHANRGDPSVVSGAEGALSRIHARCAGDASRADGKLSSGRRGRMDGAGGHARRERLPVRSRGATRLRRERLRGGRVSGQRHARADSVGHFRRGGAPPRRKAVRVAPDRPRKRRRRHHDDDAVSGGQREIARAD